MFVSFFPRPKPFFLSAVAWTALAMAFWYGFADDLVGSSSPGVVGVALFWSARSLWLDLYFALCVAIFAGAWMVSGAASLVTVVDHRFRADPVYLVLSGPGQRRHQQLVRAVLRSRPGCAFEIRSRSRSRSSTANCRPSPASPWSRLWSA